MLSASSLLLAIGLFQVAVAEEWGYHDIDAWPGICSSGGKEQSPINLNYKNVIDKEYSRFIFTNYTVQSAMVVNSGHSVMVKFPNSRSRLTGGGLPQEYSLDHFHFHWESEHTLAGHRYPAEMHLVHYGTKYGSVANAINYRDGVAVLGVFFELSPDDDDEFADLDEVMQNVIQTPSAEVKTDKLTPRSFMPRDTAGFFRYHGSLTTPPCNEGVLWTVFTNTVPISKKQAAFFQNILGVHGPLKQNYRPAQAAGDRVVFVKRSPIGSDARSQSSITSLLFIPALLLLSYFK